MNDEKIIDKFKYIQYGEANIDSIYRSNYWLYQYYNSDERLINEEDLKIENGIILNQMPIASNKYDGFHFDERYFIIDELKAINSLDESQLNYGEKRKLHSYRDYLQLKQEFSGWYNIKNRNGFYAIKEARIPEYKKAIYTGYFLKNFDKFNEDGSLNEFFYTKSIQNWKEQRDEQVKDIPHLQFRLRLLLHFNSLIAHLIEQTAKLFERAEKYDGSVLAAINSINIGRSDLKNTLKNIANTSQNINHNINTGHYKIALEIQHYCCLIFDDARSVLDNYFSIRIEQSPLKEDFDKVTEQLKNAIDMEKLDFLLRVGGISKSPTNKDFGFEISDSDSIFKNIEGQSIFQKFYSAYISEKKGQQSNFSFLFYALKKFGFINCSTARYVTFCKKHNVAINTVVTRMKYENLESKNQLILDFEKFSSLDNSAETKQ